MMMMILVMILMLETISEKVNLLLIMTSNYMNFRFFTTDYLRTGTEKVRAAVRGTVFNMDATTHKFLGVSDRFMEENDAELLKELHGGRLPYLYCGPYRDQLAMRSGYIRLTESTVRNFQMFDVSEKTSTVVPLLDLLELHMEKSPGSFSIPSLENIRELQKHRGVCMDTLDGGHQVYELTCGLSTDAEIEEGLAFYHSHFSMDSKQTGMDILAAKVEYVAVPAADWRKLPRHHGDADKFVHVKQATDDEDGIGVPVRLVLGGKNWSLHIRLDISTDRDPDGSIAYIIKHSKLQPQLMQFMQNMPVVVGFSIKQGIEDWASYMRRLGCPNFRYKRGWIEGSSLAAFAGMKTDNPSMFNLHFQTTGGILLKNNCDGDGLWSVPYQDLPKEFKVYLIGESRGTYNVAVVLLTALLHEIFPDAEVVCHLTKLSQLEFVKWFYSFVSGIIMLTEVEIDDFKKARDRQSLCGSLRFRDMTKRPVVHGCVSTDESRPLCSRSPARLLHAIQIIPPSPTVAFGGARFIVSTRKFVIKQIEILDTVEIRGLVNVFKDVTITPEVVQWITYGQQVPEEFPVAATSSEYMISDPGCSHPVICINPCTVMNSGLTQMARCQKRSARLLLLEWARIQGPDQLLIIIQRASEQDGAERESRLWISPISKYEELRTLYFHLTGKPCPVQCLWAEKRIAKYKAKAEEKAKADLEILQAQVVAAKRRLVDLADLPDDPSRKRVSLEGEITPAPKVGKHSTEAQRQRRARYRKKKREAMRIVTDEPIVAPGLLKQSTDAVEVFRGPDAISVDEAARVHGTPKRGRIIVELNDRNELETSFSDDEASELTASLSLPVPMKIADPKDLAVEGSFYKRVAEDCEKAGI